VAARVVLLSHTPDPEGVVAQATRLCYSALGIPELASELEGQELSGLLSKVISLGHHSVLEHASFTFGIEGVSRVLTHQLVRHRVASYSQQSQRYVEFKDHLPIVVPESIAGDEEAEKRFRRHCEEGFALYRELCDAGVPAEDARYLLPNATETKIIVTMNGRELRHFFTLRCCERAQWEIRYLAEQMLALAAETAPLIFKGVGPSCISGPCPEGKLTCGNIREVRARYGVSRKD
jgi:thymidylate synthase (FAD)